MHIIVEGVAQGTLLEHKSRMEVLSRPHAVMVSFPAQGHIKPLMELAKILSARGYYITFVNTEFIQEKMMKSGLTSHTMENFRFETIPDGLPPQHGRTLQIDELCTSLRKNGPAHFDKLIDKLKELPDVPPFTCIFHDGIVSWAQQTATRLGIPAICFWTTSACGFCIYISVPFLVEKGYVPLQDNSDLEEEVSCLPCGGMPPFRVKDIPSFFFDPTNSLFEFMESQALAAKSAEFIILNTFDELERPAIEALKSKLPVYSIGPLFLSSGDEQKNGSSSMTTSIWTEENTFGPWLDKQEHGSVIYVCFGSITVMSDEELVEFAWGLEASDQPFLWAIRPDLIHGSSAVLPVEFMEKVKGRGFFVRWAPQMEVLSHPSVGGFLTHSGWNSTLEGICAGVPMICWPFFAEQHINRTFVSQIWKIGLAMNEVVKRGEVDDMVRRLMRGKEGKEMRKRAGELRDGAFRAVKEGGSSLKNFDMLMEEIEGRKKR